MWVLRPIPFASFHSRNDITESSALSLRIKRSLYYLPLDGALLITLVTHSQSCPYSRTFETSDNEK
ncbi:hypothetical protein B9037_024500 [Klebsiella aerogenes]|nr:hypothetical protein B9037_024500 [Klebsiella aerogenes]